VIAGKGVIAKALDLEEVILRLTVVCASHAGRKLDGKKPDLNLILYWQKSHPVIRFLHLPPRDVAVESCEPWTVAPPKRGHAGVAKGDMRAETRLRNKVKGLLLEIKVVA
jgi:hypothetical protein